MDVFSLVAKLGLDSSEYDSGLDSAKSKASSIGGAIGGGLATAAKVGAAAIGAATAAAGAFAASSVEVGKTFDSSMSQVAATMGVTTDEISNLREFAIDMGAKTAFSATQAADALNYMALAGYTADQSMQMLPNVLNLAAAGSMDLATASDMVTDAQSALGLQMEDMDGFVDQLAKTASKSNTSVQQLGDAILTVGGTAKTLSGGTTELNTALGILADNGIKGSEGGTKLRNVILSLSAPTDKASKQLEALGVQAVDTATGDLRPLDDIMGELSKSLEGLGTAEKAEIINTIFNKQDIAAVNALLDTDVKRWDELSDAINDSKDAADKMAKTQLDNLAGDITLFKSALEGAQLLVSDSLTPSLRDFVQFGTSGLTKVSDAFKEGGLSGAIDAFGKVLSDGLELIIGKLPDFINAGMKLLGAIGQGIIDNLPTLVNASVKIVVMLVQGLVEALPELVNGAITLMQSLGQAFADNSDTLIETGKQLLEFLWNGITTGLPELAAKGVEIMQSISEGIRQNLPQLLEIGLNALMEFSGSLRENLGLLIDAGLNMILALADGLIKALPKMIETIPTIISNIAGIINDNAPKLIATGIELIGKLLAGIIQAIPTLIAEFPKIIKAIFDVITAVNWINLGSTIIKGIVNGVKSLASSLPNALKDIGSKGLNLLKNINWKNLGSQIINFIVNGVKSLVSAIPNALKSIGTNAMNAFKSINWGSLGKNIISGIVSGITSGVGNIINAAKNAASSAFNAAKSVLGIASPSKKFKWIGEMVDEGFAEGVEDNAKLVDDAISDLGNYDMNDFMASNSYGNSNNSNIKNDVIINVYGAVGQDVNELAEIISRKINDATSRKQMAWGAT